MTDSRSNASIAARREVADVTRQLVALHDLSAHELAIKYEELFGKPSRSHNKAFLRKRIAWRIQELAEGGLSAAAQQRIEELSTRRGGGIATWPETEKDDDASGGCEIIRATGLAPSKTGHNPDAKP
jgi:hypothetical protein